ncbi:MAG: polyribonucleotide nucleotidyltransferase [Deltaproteobacteria bacterium]|nr:polyribonucleotide nucleotidyltransferase [Deltaproteobacteria bacterium]MBI3387230.1 polyribonucleotide nucleotidyltransferase [Deltaproteobacteria bacterium]
MFKKIETLLAGRALTIEVGRMAKQADGAALVQYGETCVLATAVASRSAREGIDFFPLTCDYQEKTFATGKIPGGFFKREGRQSEREILNSRLIDRPIRPLFAEGFVCETQVIATVLSADKENDADMVALIAASAALHVSDIPFLGPIAAVRVGRLDGKLVINPQHSQYEASDISLVVAGTADSLVMVEGGASGVSEDVMLEALYFGHQEMQILIKLQEELRQAVGKPKRAVVVVAGNADLTKRAEAVAGPLMRKALAITGKQERVAALRQAMADTQAALAAEFPSAGKAVKEAVEEIESQIVRGVIVESGKRIDGRGLKDIRPVSCEVGVLPRTHGSALFTRGETQALVVATLGTSADEQKIDALIGEYYKKFMLHYNFPPFSVGEVRPLRGPSRRDVGHGALAERSVVPVLPAEATFPYTVRMVSEVLESNGSSSMATVCGSSLALMDAGVPTKGAVAGIAMGLIKDGDKVRILSDILGDEDHLGDMDFKVAGTSEGITGLQMDIKIRGVTREIMREALHQAREGRLHILGIMNQTLPQARGDISPHAPRIVTIKIKPDKIRDVIGPGGKVIRAIVEETGAKIDIEDDGTVFIASSDGASLRKAIERIEGLTAEAQVGKIYKGKVRKIVDFGAFVEIMPGTDGLIHISQLAEGRVQKVTDVLKEGDEVMVKVLEVDRQGKIRLSRKEALGAAAGQG